MSGGLGQQSLWEYVQQMDQKTQMNWLTAITVGIASIAALIFIIQKWFSKEEDNFEKVKAVFLEEEAKKDKKGKNKKGVVQQKQKQPEDAKEQKPVVAVQQKENKRDEEKDLHKQQVPVPDKIDEPKKVASEPAAAKKETATTQRAAPAAKQTNKQKKAAVEKEEEMAEDDFIEARTKKAKRQEKKEAPIANDRPSPPSPQAPVQSSPKQQPPSPRETKPAPVTTAPPPPAPKQATPPPPQQRFVTVGDLDSDKVITRLMSVDELEPEYLAYLATYFQKTADKLSTVEKNQREVQRQLEEQARAGERMRQATAKQEKDLADKERVVRELSSRSAHAQSEEQQAKRQLTSATEELEKTRRELEKERKRNSVAPTIIKPKEDTEMKAELDRLRQEARLNAGRVEELQKQLTTKDKIENDKVLYLQSREDEIMGREVLLAEARQNTKAVAERLKDVEVKNQQLSARAYEMENTIVQLKTEFHAREMEYEKNTAGLKKMIDDLQKEIVQFENAKAELHSMAARLMEKEDALQQRNSSLVAAEALVEELKEANRNASEAAREELKSLYETERTVLQKRCASLEVELAAEKKRVVEIPLNNVKDIVEEVVELKPSAYLNTAPPAKDDEKEALREEVERLKAKNSELRSRNHAVMDQLTDLEKRLVAKSAPVPNGTTTPAAGPSEDKKAAAKSDEERIITERRLVVANVGKLVANAPKLDEKADLQAYEKWLKSMSTSLKEAQSKAEQAVKEKKQDKSKPVDSSIYEAELELLRSENEGYRDALANLESELSNIGELAAKREEGFLKRIAALEKNHGKGQIASLRATIDGLPPAAGASPSSVPAPTSPPTSQSEDDGSWEVVA